MSATTIPHRCLNCSKPITWTFALCSDCELIYGSRTGTWPEWLRWLWADTQRDRRRDKNIRKFEVSLDDITDITEFPNDIYDN